MPHFRDQLNHLTKAQLSELVVALREEVLQLRPDEVSEVPIYQTHWQQISLPQLEDGEISARLMIIIPSHESFPEISMEDSGIQVEYFVLDTTQGWTPQNISRQLEGRLEYIDILIFLLPNTSFDISAPKAAQTMLDIWSATMALAAVIAERVSPPRLWLFTHWGQSLPEDEHEIDTVASPLIALGKSLSLECPRMWGGCIDLDTSTLSLTSAIEEVLCDAGDEEVAYRAGIRYIPELHRSTTATKSTGDMVRLKPNATYLVTGGMGGIGRRLVSHLLNHGVSRVVVFGRRGKEVPEIEQTLNHWHRMYPHAEIDLISVDLGNLSAVREALDDLRRQGPALKGIFHVAGSSQQVALNHLDIDSIDSMMRAKAAGALFLDVLTRDAALDFQIYFSSISGCWGTASLIPYAMANRFLDALSTYRNHQGHFTKSIAWGPWANIGMVIDQQQESFSHLGLGLIEPNVGMAMLGRLMNTVGSQVQVVDVAWQRYAQHLPMDKHLRWFRHLIGGAETIYQPVVENTSLENFSDPQQTLEVLCSIVSELLGEVLIENAVYKPTQEIGLTSILGVELSQRIRQRFEVPCRPTVIYDYPNLYEMSVDISEQWYKLYAQTMKQEANAPTVEQTHSTHTNAQGNEAIAIVAMACQLPSADNPESLWTMMEQALNDGKDVINRTPVHRFDLSRFCSMNDESGKAFNLAGGYLDDISGFDHACFQLSHNEAKFMDPQQRLAIETTWRAFEDAGIEPHHLIDGTSSEMADTGVFFGIGQNEYGPLCRSDISSEYAGLMPTGQSMNLIAGRISHLFGLKGPAIAYDTACSSSLVALDAAVRHLRRESGKIAIVGGVNTLIAPESFVLLSKAGALSKRGRGSAFDASADGYVRAEGCVVMVLKRLSDAQAAGDRIHAVIHGSAVNHDGRSSGLTAPNGRAQEQVIRAALKDAEVSPEQVTLVEAHGTGTPLGDPIEYHALRAVYTDGKSRSAPLKLGTIKSFIGHTESASGLAGLLKLVLTLQKRTMPGQLHFNTINPYIDATQGIVIPRQSQVLEDTGRLLGAVSSFGFNGTNAHVIVERGEGGHSRALPAQPFHRVRCWYSDRPLNESVGLAQAFSQRQEQATQWCVPTKYYVKRWKDAEVECHQAASELSTLSHVLLVSQKGAERLCQQWYQTLVAQGLTITEASFEQVPSLQGRFDRTVVCLNDGAESTEDMSTASWQNSAASVWQVLQDLVTARFESGHLLVCESSRLNRASTGGNSCWQAVLSCYRKERADFSATLVSCNAELSDCLPQSMTWLLTTKETECYLSANQAYIPRLTELPPFSANYMPILSAQHSYIVTGGTGGAGASLIQWLLRCGARHIINLNRRPPDEAQTVLLQQWCRDFNASIQTVRGDVSNFATLQGVLENTLAKAPPLNGIFHCAGVLEQNLFEQHTWSQVEEMLHAKHQGTLNLHRATLDQPLQYFVVFSSLVSLLGQSGQSGYAFSNAMAEKVILHRRTQNLPGLAIQWGPWAGGGMASRAGKGLAAHYRQMGVSMLEEESYLHALGGVLASATEPESLPPVIAIGDIDWQRYLSTTMAPLPLCEDLHSVETGLLHDQTENDEPDESLSSSLSKVAPERRMRLLKERLKQIVSECLDQNAPQLIEDFEGFSALGIDSLHSMILHKKLEKELGCPLPQTIAFDYPTITALSSFLAKHQLGSLFVHTPSMAQEEHETDEMVNYSEDELARILHEEIERLEETS
ncbi:SDR family NAD(P)-dependent oxidoreductase [Vibrio rhizosphaerae]|uniref:SDR family NAD(P)-dependent oxidoreductase n=1 Tax=Vibrio rhizosphaerae TaxID=398736 RepID=UPI000B0BE2E0|nr:SDR family NAD(P)-dependent oxidoreductase [Vibrio rhizosphaerae]